MNETLERMLRIVLMNQIEVMTALEELLGPEPLTQDDLAGRAEIRANLGDAIDQTVDSLKDLREQGSTGSGDFSGQA